jgi:pimeloyl-ACP methyl ester carboxylesterase
MSMERYRPLSDQSNDHLDAAGALMLALGKSTKMPLREQDEALLSGATPFRFGPGNSRNAWSIGNGPLVILVHGYGGRGTQMAMIASEIAAHGYECIFFDAGGHGSSITERVGFFTFMNDVRDLRDHLSCPIHAMIGHSAGGLAMMRARELYDVRADKYAVICAPFYPYVPLNNMRDRGAPEGPLEYVKAVLSDQFQTNWSSLVKGKSFEPEDGKPMLAIYDTDDKNVQHTDADQLAAHWAGTRVVKTSGYGHNRILQAPETISAMRDYFAGAQIQMALSGENRVRSRT